MPTIEAHPLYRRFTPTDPRLIDMLDGALRPARPPAPAPTQHDFLVMNPYENFSAKAEENEQTV